jgi:predicted GH43/DUF377 family glycosyl hydrolase
MPLVERWAGNPILEPLPAHAWEARAVFNPCVVRDAVDGETVAQVVYRAESHPRDLDGHTLVVSAIGHGVSREPGVVEARRLLIEPEEPWERFGCEDPRITRFDDEYWIFYTALSRHPFEADGIRVGLARTRDFQQVEKAPVTPFNAKAMALFPEPVAGRIAAILTVDTDRPPAHIAVALFDDPADVTSPAWWRRWRNEMDRHTVRVESAPGEHLEVGAPPVATPEGWLLVYCRIRNYGHPHRLFGIEALLLDRADPTRVLGRTQRPLLCPEEAYERFGHVPDTIFPSGAVITDDRVEIYYGAADTCGCLATCSLSRLLEEVRAESLCMARSPDNPLVTPDPERSWEAHATFNAGALRTRDRVHILYRAMGENQLSVLGYAASRDGLSIEERLELPVYQPRAEFERPAAPGVGGGCEDPRLTVLEGRVHMLYTAYDGVHPPRVAHASISLKDFEARRWVWTAPVLASRPGEMNKDAALFPRRVDGRVLTLHRAGHSIWLDRRADADFGEDRWLSGAVLMDPPPRSPKIGAGGPPIWTPEGWLLLYHEVSSRPQHHYHLKAALLDLDDPGQVRARMRYPFLEPQELYERVGPVPNVVFSCGQAVVHGRLVVYYGGADRVLAAASIDLDAFVRRLVREHGTR